MHQRFFVTTAILLIVLAAGCWRETVDKDMAAATETTATTATETSGTLSATTTGSTGGSVSAMSPDDKEFVIQAASSNLAEVTLSELAFTRSEDATVKAFSQRMLNDHGRANEELQKIAAVKGLALPTGLDQDRQKGVDSLRGQPAAQFNRAYAAQMVTDHEKAVAMFQSAETAVQDPDVRGWVVKTLPTLREHLQHAKTLNSAIR
jgi:putative membrane protein